MIVVYTDSGTHLPSMALTRCNAPSDPFFVAVSLKRTKLRDEATGCELDPSAHQIRMDGISVRIQPLPRKHR